MNLDILHMKYLAAIVDANFNLSDASKQIHVTQSTFSQFISNFEKKEGVSLFIRENGRLKSLSPIGKKLYNEMLEIFDKYEKMEGMIENEASKRKGIIRIGLPTTILRILFTRFFPRFMIKNPDIKIDIIEADTLTLRQMLIEKDLHFAILEEPTNLDIEKFEQHIIMLSEIAAFINPNSNLINKRLLSWRDLDDQYITFLNDGFIYNSEITNKLESIHSTAKVLMTSSSWDYLVEASIANDIVSILPTARFPRYLDRLQSLGVVEKRFEDPIPFTTYICRPKKTRYSPAENYVYETILNGFYKITENE